MELWVVVYNSVKRNKRLRKDLENLPQKIIVIDHLNQISQLRSLFTFFNRNIATDIVRSGNYLYSANLHSIGCHRDQCQGEVGLKRIVLSDPVSFRFESLPKSTKQFFKALSQQTSIGFIDVQRYTFRKDLWFTVNPIKTSNYLNINANGKFSKELDDMIVLALFIVLQRMGKDVYIQTCDKYRWTKNIEISTAIRKESKERKLIPFFLHRSLFIEDPALLLMGYECAYDCTVNQRTPFDEMCNIAK
jgi:hypothetical protein